MAPFLINTILIWGGGGVEKNLMFPADLLHISYEHNLIVVVVYLPRSKVKVEISAMLDISQSL